jgi:hypothetical protein
VGFSLVLLRTSCLLFVLLLYLVTITSDWFVLRGYGLAYHLTDKAPLDESTDGFGAKVVKAWHTDDGRVMSVIVTSMNQSLIMSRITGPPRRCGTTCRSAMLRIVVLFFILSCSRVMYRSKVVCPLMSIIRLLTI